MSGRYPLMSYLIFCLPCLQARSSSKLAQLDFDFGALKHGDWLADLSLGQHGLEGLPARSPCPRPGGHSPCRMGVFRFSRVEVSAYTQNHIPTFPQIWYADVRTGLGTAQILDGGVPSR